MKINKDTLVSNLNGFKNCVKLEELVIILSEVYGGDYDLNEIIECEEYEDEDFYIQSDHESGDIDFSCSNNFSREKFKYILEKIFREEFYYMDSIDFILVNIDGSKFKNQLFYQFKICLNDKEDDIDIVTKNYHGEIEDMKPNDFLTEYEKEHFDSLEKRDNVYRHIDGDSTYYYISKKDFNKDKWWLGWTSEND